MTRLISAAELRDRPRPNYLVHHVLAKTGVGQLYGPTYSGKSFVAMSLALSITNANVSDWFGFPVTLHGPVVYALMERRVRLPRSDRCLATGPRWDDRQRLVDSPRGTP